jgi:intraflagellar transport protein 88
LDVLAWLGSYYIENSVYEQAIQYFERAILIQPNEPNWYLMIASCLRRAGSYQQALSVYKRTHERFPENTDCTKLQNIDVHYTIPCCIISVLFDKLGLRFMTRLCNDMGLAEGSVFATKLSKLEDKAISKANAERIASPPPMSPPPSSSPERTKSPTDAMSAMSLTDTNKSVIAATPMVTRVREFIFNVQQSKLFVGRNTLGRRCHRYFTRLAF